MITWFVESESEIPVQLSDTTPVPSTAETKQLEEAKEQIRSIQGKIESDDWDKFGSKPMSRTSFYSVSFHRPAEKSSISKIVQAIYNDSSTTQNGLDYEWEAVYSMTGNKLLLRWKQKKVSL